MDYDEVLDCIAKKDIKQASYIMTSYDLSFHELVKKAPHYIRLVNLADQVRLDLLEEIKDCKGYL